MEIKNIISQIWEVYNDHSVNGVFIISKEKLSEELERIEIQNTQ